MKKILSFFIAAALLFSVTACGQAPVTIELDTIKPWETETMYEKATYKIERFRMVRQGKETVRDGDPIAEGEVVMEIKEGTAAADENAVMEIKTTYTVTYEDSERAGADRGLTDTITSTATFRKTGLAPVRSERTAVIAKREGRDDLSYHVTADYTKSEAVMDWNERTDNLTMKLSGTIFDNEQLYYVTRAFKSLAPSSSVSFTLLNLHDSFLNGFQTYPMSVSCAEEKETLYIDDWATKFGLESDGNGHAKVECMKATIGKTGTLPGPAQTVYYANQAFKIDDRNSTAKVIVHILLREYDMNAVESFNTGYTLTGYTTTPEA